MRLGLLGLALGFLLGSAVSGIAQTATYRGPNTGAGAQPVISGYDNGTIDGYGNPVIKPVGPNSPLPTKNAPYSYSSLGCEQITSLVSAAGFASVPAGATLVALDVEGQSVRYRDDGTAPTASVGVLLPVGGPWPYSASLSSIEFIQTAATATINACFYK